MVTVTTSVVASDERANRLGEKANRIITIACPSKVVFFLAHHDKVAPRRSPTKIIGRRPRKIVRDTSAPLCQRNSWTSSIGVLNDQEGNDVTSGRDGSVNRNVPISQ